jgi:integrase
MAEDKVGRNVALVIKTPAGKKPGQQRRAFSADEMLAIMKAAHGWAWKNMDAYIALSFATGASPDEIRGLHWAQVDDLDGDAPGIVITRTVRHGGGTKTHTRTRGLGLPQFAVDALKRHRAEQAAARLAAGSQWEDNDLVFCTRVGRPLAYANVGRAFRKVCELAGIEDAAKRVPYEMRHTHASLVWDSGMTAEEVALQLGHGNTRTFEAVYRHVVRPPRVAGQQVMERIFTQAQAG